MRLTLKDGIEVGIIELHQWGTYNGLIEGLPTDKINARFIKRVVKRAQEMCYLEDYHLIEPEQSPIKADIPYPFGKPMRLPSVVCVAQLLHYKPVRDEDMHASTLLLIWFQETYCFPIGDKILEKMKEVDWVKLAVDFEY